MVRITFVAFFAFYFICQPTPLLDIAMPANFRVGSRAAGSSHSPRQAAPDSSAVSPRPSPSRPLSPLLSTSHMTSDYLSASLRTVAGIVTATTLSPGNVPERELKAALPEKEWEPQTGRRTNSLAAPPCQPFPLEAAGLQLPLFLPEPAAGKRAEPARHSNRGPRRFSQWTARAISATWGTPFC